MNDFVPGDNLEDIATVTNLSRSGVALLNPFRFLLKLNYVINYFSVLPGLILFVKRVVKTIIQQQSHV